MVMPAACNAWSSVWSARTAIERFERARGMPVTGQVSDRLVRELSSLVGRPLE